MNEIKVSVAYEAPSTSKFDALMAEYEAAKTMADETVAHYKPLADVAEVVKFDAIMEQLETIKEYANKISAIENNRVVYITAHIPSAICHSNYRDGQTFNVIYRPKQTQCMWEIRSRYGIFNRDGISYHSQNECNFIGKWDEWQVYQKLENDACRQLKEAIAKQVARGQKQIDRFNNIVK